MRNAIKAVGARLLFLPKYSPDLNPIEQVFAKLKGFLQSRPRTLDAISRAIAQALATIPPAECQNYLAPRICVSLDAERSSATPKIGDVPSDHRTAMPSQCCPVPATVRWRAS